MEWWTVDTMSVCDDERRREDALASTELVDEASKRPDITLDVVGLSIDEFR